MHKLLYFLVILPILGTTALPSTPSVRLVSTSPQLTQILFEVGLGGYVVAAPMAGWPIKIQGLRQGIRSIGDLALNFEAIVRSRADWVLLDSQLDQRDLAASLRSYKMRFYTLNFRSAEELARSLAELRDRLDLIGNTDKLTSRIACLNAISAVTSSRKFSFIIVIAWDPLIVYGRSTFLSSIITALGGENVVSIPMLFPQLSREWLMMHKPERIYSLDSSGPRFSNVISLDPDQYSRVAFATIGKLSEVGLVVPGDCL